MDDLNNSFGRLSTKAAEFVPGGAGNAPATDLRASQLQEFVPGQAWGAQQQEEILPSQSAVSQESVESTVVSGPTPVPSFRALHSLGLSDDLWRYYRERSFESMRQMAPDDPRHKAVPLPYCNAYCLDVSTARSSFGYPSHTFQVTNREDSHLYCLRRLDSVRSVSHKIAAAVTDRWLLSNVNDHPGVVPFYQCFVAQRAVFFVHQYIPGARSLQERLQSLPEPILWSVFIQIVSAVRTIHVAGLAVRTLDPAHILSNADSTNSRLRVRINCLGIVDALEFEARKPVADLQQQDIRQLGRLILSLATGQVVTPRNESQCEAYLAQNYSRELHNIAVTLMNSRHPPSILDVSRAVAQRCLDEQDDIYRQVDRTDAALAAEYESGRALRLLLKLGFVNERPEFGPNRRWAQSGDCYVLSLFRDYVFHQADGAGNPVMDLGHVITALNKLDAADEEKIVLSSRDGKSLMVVSYADVARCLETAFHELCSGAVPPVTLQY